MAELKWEWVETLYNGIWVADGVDHMRIIPLIGSVEVLIRDVRHHKSDGTKFTDVDTAKTVCQTDYDARVKTIAEANGYVRVDAGQVVVNRDDLHSILFDANRINEFDFDALVLMRLQKALETKS